jgi:hypothetical protein
MARRKIVPLRPMHELNPREKTIRRNARSLGFKNEREYRAWINKFGSLPESDPRYFDKKLFTGARRNNEIKRLKKIIKQTRTPAKEVRRKMDLLVNTISRMSAFDFLQSYGDMIRALLADPETSEYDKRILRKLLKDLQNAATVPGTMLPTPEEGMLF